MPEKIVDVPGIGLISFPDTMSDTDIAATIKKQSPALGSLTSAATAPPSFLDRFISRTPYAGFSGISQVPGSLKDIFAEEARQAGPTIPVAGTVPNMMGGALTRFASEVPGVIGDMVKSEFNYPKRFDELIAKGDSVPQAVFGAAPIIGTPIDDLTNGRIPETLGNLASLFLMSKAGAPPAAPTEGPGMVSRAVDAVKNAPLTGDVIAALKKTPEQTGAIVGGGLGTLFGSPGTGVAVGGAAGKIWGARQARLAREARALDAAEGAATKAGIKAEQAFQKAQDKIAADTVSTETATATRASRSESPSLLQKRIAQAQQAEEFANQYPELAVPLRVSSDGELFNAVTGEAIPNPLKAAADPEKAIRQQAIIKAKVTSKEARDIANMAIQKNLGKDLQATMYVMEELKARGITDPKIIKEVFTALRGGN